MFTLDSYCVKPVVEEVKNQLFEGTTKWPMAADSWGLVDAHYMCCSKLIKTDFSFTVCVREYSQELVCVLCMGKCMCMCESTSLWAAAVCYLFFQPCHTNYSPYLLTFSFCFVPSIGICKLLCLGCSH